LVVDEKREFLKRVFRKNITRPQADPLAFGLDALLRKYSPETHKIASQGSPKH